MEITNLRPAQQVVDDLGFVWLFEDRKIRLPEADSDIGYEENGYYCDSFEEGVQLLKEYGYITEPQRG